MRGGRLMGSGCSMEAPRAQKRRAEPWEPVTLQRGVTISGGLIRRRDGCTGFSLEAVAVLWGALGALLRVPWGVLWWFFFVWRPSWWRRGI